MSRIRTIKPEFWVSEQVITCSLPARLLFVGLWNFSDDNGIHPASHIRLKAEIYPGDNCSVDDVKRWLNELIVNELVREYQVDGKAYWIILGWHKHQKIDRPSYKHPLPQSEVRKITDENIPMVEVKSVQDSPTNRLAIVKSSSQPRRMFDENLSNGIQALVERHPPEGSLMEGSLKEEYIREVETSPSIVFDMAPIAGKKKIEASEDVLEIFDYWKKKLNHPNAKLDSKRKTKIVRALKIYSVEEIKSAIDGCGKTPHNMGHNPSGKKYDDIELILRDASHIEGFMAANSLPSYSQSDELMSGVI